MQRRLCALTILVKRGRPCQVMKVQASVARCLRTPPYAAKRKGLSFDLRTALSGESDRSTVVICNCTICTDNGGGSPKQSYIFTRSSILFRPHLPSNEGGFGGVAGYRPRVRSAYSMRVYAHSSLARTLQI
jgi:hypothetical protein